MSPEAKRLRSKFRTDIIRLLSQLDRTASTKEQARLVKAIESKRALIASIEAGIYDAVTSEVQS